MLLLVTLSFSATTRAMSPTFLPECQWTALKWFNLFQIWSFCYLFILGHHPSNLLLLNYLNIFRYDTVVGHFIILAHHPSNNTQLLGAWRLARRSLWYCCLAQWTTSQWHPGCAKTWFIFSISISGKKTISGDTLLLPNTTFHVMGGIFAKDLESVVLQVFPIWGLLKILWSFTFVCSPSFILRLMAPWSFLTTWTIGREWKMVATLFLSLFCYTFWAQILLLSGRLWPLFLHLFCKNWKTVTTFLFVTLF